MLQDGLQTALLYFELGHSIVNILFLLLFAIGLSGALRVLRQYAWLENVHAPTDFVRGLRDNCRQLLTLAFLGGAASTLCLLVLFFSTSYRSGLAASVSLIPIGLSLLLGLPVLAIAVVMVPVYSNTLTAHLKNAFYVYTHAPFRVLLALLCGSLLWVPTLIPNLYFHLFGGIVVVVLLPIFLLAWTLFCYGLFDQWINPACCPELIGRGIRHDST